MVRGFWGKKIGMTQVFVQDKVVPVTVVDIADWVVTQIKQEDRDGYSAVQVGRVKKRYADKKFSPDWLKSLKHYFGTIKEIRLDKDIEGVTVGKKVDLEDSFAAGDHVDVFGKTKGCGFAGVVRRHNFGGPPASHGHTMGKRTGSLSFMCSQGRVIKGKKMPGHMGNKQQMMKNLEVVRIDASSQVVLLKGSVPGRPGSLMFVRKA
jgi:large subunit ribosomal protein L3